MNPATIESEVLACEKQYWEAVKNKDGATAARLTDEHCLVTGPRGVHDFQNEDLAGMFDKPTQELRSSRIDDRELHVRALTDDVAVIAYKVREQVVRGGKPESMDAFDSSVWVKRKGRWVCAMHTETLPDDKTPA